MIKVSIIIPVYNAEKYLRVALDSLINQTLKEIEIICVDDGSTDSSYEILEEYAKKDDRFTVLRQKNKYAGAARNVGMQYARGEYLSFLDADDFFKPDMLEKAYNCGVSESADVVVFGVGCFVDNPRNEWNIASWLNEKMLPIENGFNSKDVLPYLLNFTCTAPWNKIFKRSFVEKHQIQYQEIKRWNDICFVETALAVSNKIAVVRQNLIVYRVDNNSSLQGTRDETIIDCLHAFYGLLEQLKSRQVFDSIWLSFCNLCLSICISTLERISTKQSFEEFYHKLKNEAFEKLYITKMKASDCIDLYLYREYEYVMNHTSEEYLFDKYKSTKRDNNKKYLFPFEVIEKNSSIIIYGAGVVGCEYNKQVHKRKYCSVLAWVDKNAKRLNNDKVKGLNEVEWQKCNYVVIAVESDIVAESIKNELIEAINIPESKIIWREPEYKRILETY